MRYLMLMWTVDDGFEGGSAEDWQAWEDYEKMLRDRSALIEGTPLLPDVVRVTPLIAADPDIAVPTEPTAPGVALGGWYLIEAPDADTASELASAAPLYGTVEVRAVQSYED